MSDITDFLSGEQLENADRVNRLVQVCHSASREAGWWGAWSAEGRMHPDDVLEVCRRTRLGLNLVGTKIALVHSEVSEALEGVRKDKMDEHLPHRKSVEVELADAAIRIFDLAGALDLDLGGALVEKMEYNRRRADHKPEARAAEGGKAF